MGAGGGAIDDYSYCFFRDNNATTFSKAFDGGRNPSQGHVLVTKRTVRRPSVFLLGFIFLEVYIFSRNVSSKYTQSRAGTDPICLRPCLLIVHQFLRTWLVTMACLQ